MSAEAGIDEGRKAELEAWYGRFEGRARIPDLARHGAENHPGAMAWELALRSHAFLAGMRAQMPAPADLLALELNERSRSGLGAAWFLQGRAALLSLDQKSLVEAARRVHGLSAEDERLGPWALCLSLWSAVMRGETGGGAELRAALDDLSERAAQAKLPALVIEASVLKAEASLNGQDLASAAKSARRASRMARTEGMPQQEYLANLTLARFRRRSGNPHLAARIIAGLCRVAPPAWTPCLSWEAHLSAAPVPGPGGPSEALSSFFASSLKGHVDDIKQAASEVLNRTSGFYRAQREAHLLMCATVPTLYEDMEEPELSPWMSGAEVHLPHGLRAAVNSVQNPHLPVTGHTWVVARPGAAPLRFLHPGIGLFFGLPRIERTQKRHGRTECAAAVLVLAGSRGVALREFTPAVYGFPYSPQTHDGVLRVLLHRLRDSLGDHGTVERGDDSFYLTPRSTFLVPDPRTSPPTGERVLRMVAARPGATSQEVAQALGISVRTVQNELRVLVDEGACASGKVNGRVQYAVEDTTYSEPTDLHSL